MLDRLITSKTRLRMLLKFFSAPEGSAYLRELATEFGESTNSIRVELNNLADSGFLIPFGSGRTIRYKANISHPLFREVQRLVLRHIEVDRIIEKILSKLGRLEQAYLVGGHSMEEKGLPVELVLIGTINESYLSRLSQKASLALGREIRCKVILKKDFDVGTLPVGAVLIWGINQGLPQRQLV